MTKVTALFLAACTALAGCATQKGPVQEGVVRSIRPHHEVAAITNYFDARAKENDPNRELVVGEPQRGACPLGINGSGYVGWVVPVEYKTRTSDSATVTVTRYFFWFSDETVRGVTRRIEVCP